MKIYGFIIAAGNQTRFNSETPKVLSKLKNKTCLDYTMNNMKIICDDVYVVCSKDKEDYFKDYNYIAIDSGLGCGDAVLKTLEKFKFEDDDMCFIQWGDTINEFNVYLTLKSKHKKNCCISVACRYENRPYVKIDRDSEKKKYNVYFSKYGEVKGSGYHDLSAFYGYANSIKHFCEIFRDKFFKEDHYDHKHGNEFNFLDIFNDTYIIGNIVPMKHVRSCSFNTEDEYKELLKKVDEWEHF